MARGRMINKEITMDKRINDLSDDTSRLGFTWLITFADREGRIHGDPAVLRSILFPRRSDVTVENMAEYIQEWHDIGLITWYEAEGDKWISLPKFENHQTGLRKDREPESNIPPPPSALSADTIRKDAGNDPEQIPVKRKEEKRKEEKGKSGSLPAVFEYYQNNIGVLTPGISDAIQGAIVDYPEPWVMEALEIAVKRNKRRWDYAEGVLKNWYRDGKNNDDHKDPRTVPKDPRNIPTEEY